MPSPYAKSSQQLFWDLVNASNPQLKIPLSDANCVIYGYPQAVTSNAASGYRNTKIRLYAKVGMGYKGEVSVYYNRLNIASFFVGITPTVTHYTANTPALVMDVFNATYGLQLTYANRFWADSTPTWTLGMTIPDIMMYSSSYQAGAASSDNTKRYITANESLCWVGGTNLDIGRIRGNPDYGTLITKPEIVTMRKVPVQTPNTYNTALLTWGYDFTDKQTTIANFLSSPTNRTYQLALAQMLADVTGLPFAWGNGGAAGALDLQGFTQQQAQLALGTRYHTNTDDYNRCLMLYRDTTPLGAGWSTDGWQGMNGDQDDVNNTVFRHMVFMHYNA